MLSANVVLSRLLAASASLAAATLIERLRRSRDRADGLVHQLSFPLVVPIDDPAERVGVAGETHPAVPQMSGGWLIVPLENAGLGPAIDVRADVEIVEHMREKHREARIGVIAAGRRAALRVALDGSLGDFQLRLSFQDHLACRHRLNARWTAEDRSYAVDWQPPASHF